MKNGIVITDKLRKALLAFYHESGKNQTDLCKFLGISQAAWSRIINKSSISTTFIRSKTWMRIYPHLKGHLPKEFEFAMPIRVIKKRPGYDALTIDLLNQWGVLDRRDKLRTLAFIEHLNQEKNQSVRSSGA